MKIDITRSLKNRFPEIAKEWHPTLNDPLTPNDVTYGSKKVVWWQCPKDEKHSYETIICDRTRKDIKKRSGCPYCASKQLLPEKSLLFCSPDIANLWHPTLNTPVTPSDVFSRSNKKYWWKCPIKYVLIGKNV